MKRILISIALVAVLVMPEANAQFNYGEALQKSLFFYEVQQSGPLPDWNRVSWRADATINDGADVGLNLNGGWFDAGDHVKFNFPMAFSVTTLAWGGIEYEEAYRNSGQLDILKRNLRFVTDYFIRCHTAPNELWGQVGNGGVDHSWWGSPEVYPQPRPSYKIDEANPGSDLAAETAAAMAAVSILLKDDDPTYSATLREHAIQLYDFADNFRDSYSNSITDASGFYRSFSGYNDEIVWGAIWMYKATNDPSYLAKAEAEYDNMAKEGQSSTAKYKEAFSWDDKAYGCYVALAQLTGKEKYKQDAQNNLDYFTVGVNGDVVPKTPGGLPHLRQWGTIRYASNQSLLALIYADKVTTDPVLQARYSGFAKDMVDYALGDNPINRSFMNGFGNDPANDPHHRGNSGNWTNSDGGPPTDASHILYGAVVGGPKEPNNDSFEDNRGEFVANEVACDYNACITGVLARMYGEFGGEPLANFPIPEEPTRAEIRSVSKFNSNNNFGTTISINIQNRTAWPARVTDQLSYRYYFDIAEGIAEGYTIDDYNIQLNNIGGTATMEIRPVGGSVYYAEITNLPSIAPIGDPAFRTETQINIRVQNGVPYDVDNDWSAQGLGGSAIESSNIPVYDNGVLVFGTEPAGADVPRALITTNVTSGDIPLTVSFDGSDSSDPNGDVLTYVWDFSDGSTAIGVSAEYTYTTPGEYTATLTVDDGNGNTDSETVVITVTAPNVDPVAQFTASVVSGDVPLMVSFDASTSSDENGDNLTYSWDFGDGFDAGGVAPTHTFRTAGVFTVTLTVFDGRGGQSTATTEIEVIAVPNDPPVAVLAVSSTSGETPFTVTFDGSGSSDPDNDALTYTWDFGDGNTGSGVIVSHTYTTAGSFTATLTVNDEKGGIATDDVTLSVAQGACGLLTLYGVPTAEELPSIGNTKYRKIYVLGTGGPDFSNVREMTIDWANESWGSGLWQLSIQTNDGVPSWWQDLKQASTHTFGQTSPGITFTNSGFPGLDGSYYVNMDGENVVFVEQSGAYAIYLSNSDTTPAGCGTGNPNDQPVAIMSVSSLVGDAPLTVTFDGSGSTDPNNDVLTYTWDFGDGSTGSGASVSHTYTTIGRFVATLTVNDGKGGIDAASVTINTTSQGTCNLLTQYGVPLSDGLPTIAHTRYTYVHVLGTGGPDLSNLQDMTISWANESWGSGLWQLSIQTTDGVPEWWQDLQKVSTHNFAEPNPSVTFTDSGFPGLDGMYYINTDGGNVVWVEASGAYALYFSNSPTAPLGCSAQASSFSVQIHPNPSTSAFALDLSKVEADEVILFNASGQQVENIPVGNKSDQGVVTFGSNLKQGIYYLRVRQNGTDETIRLIKN